jgi:hypothetical protein
MSEEEHLEAALAASRDEAARDAQRRAAAAAAAMPTGAAHAAAADEEEELAMALELSRQIAACTREPRIASRSVEVDLTDKGGCEACANGMSVDAPIELSSDEDEAVAPGLLPAAVAVDDASTEEDEPTPTPTANVPLKEVREARLRHFVA